MKNILIFFMIVISFKMSAFYKNENLMLSQEELKDDTSVEYIKSLEGAESYFSTKGNFFVTRNFDNEYNYIWDTSTWKQIKVLNDCSPYFSPNEFQFFYTSLKLQIQIQVE